MKPITARAVGLAVALCALMGICACVWPQTAYAQDAYTAKPLGSSELLEEGYCLTLLQESNGMSYGNVSGGKIVVLDVLPEAHRNTTGGIRTWKGAPSPTSVSYTWPNLVNNKDASGNWAYIGGDGEAFAFVADADAANNGADGARFSATWKKAAVLRSTSAQSEASLTSNGTYVDIKIDFTLHNTVYNPESNTEKAVIQFHNRFDWGFWQFNVMRVDQTITFYDSATGEEFPINGKLDILGTSMDMGEGFTVKGASSSAVSSTAPVTNTHVPGVTTTPGIEANGRWSTVPGSYVYEINEDGWLGYVGAPDARGVPDSILYVDEGNKPRGTQLQYVDNKYDSAYVFELGGKVFPTDADEDAYASSVTYAWRSASVGVEMGGSSSVEVRQYAVGYEGWPAVDVLSGVGKDAGAIKTLGHATNNFANPSLDTMASSGFENGGKKFYTIAFSGLYGTNPGTPEKHVADHGALGVGDTAHFTIAQKVNTYGDNLFSPYTQLSLYDVLDKNLALASASVYYVSPSGIETDVTGYAGNLANDTDTGKVTYTFSKSYLQSKDTGTNIDPRAGMVYQGGTYELRIAARIASDAQMKLTNIGYANINGEEKATAEVPVLVDTARIELTKDVRFENAVGDEAIFTLTVVNTEANSTARDVVVQDASLPANMTVKESSLSISGAPATVEAALVEDNQVVNREVANEARVTLDGNAVRAHIPYLPAGVPVTITFAAACDAVYAGQKVTNTASATFANPASGAEKRVEAADTLWVNSAQLSVLKRANAFEYHAGDVATYTLSIANTTTGSIARGVTVTDSALPDCVRVDFDSIEIHGVPDAVDYPIDGNDAQATEQRNAGWVVTESGNGFVLEIPYLPAGALATVTYQAECLQDANGLETMNTALATLDNPLPGYKEVSSSDAVWTNEAVLALTKTAAQYENQVGEKVHYTLEVSNVASGTVAKEVVVQDVALPAGFALVEDSVSISGAPDVVSYPIDGDGQHAVEERENTSSVEVIEGGFKANLAYLPAGSAVRISYDAVPSEALNGSVIVNAASVACANAVGGAAATAEAPIWINTPNLEVKKTVVEPKETYAPGDAVTYRVAVTNTAPGTVAHDIVVRDAFQSEGLELVGSTVAAYGDSNAAIEGVITAPSSDNSGFSVALSTNLVCEDGTYRIWRARQEEAQSALNPAGQTQHASLVVEYQAVVTEAAGANESVGNAATAEGSNAQASGASDVTVVVDGNGSGGGSGSGSGDGSGGGSGDGSGSGSGDGSGSGSGDGSGDGSGGGIGPATPASDGTDDSDGSGDGSGSESGDGSGDGSGGDGSGSSSGDDTGNSSGNGSGSGAGNGVSDRNGPGTGAGSGADGSGSGISGSGSGNGSGAAGSGTSAGNGSKTSAGTGTGADGTSGAGTDKSTASDGSGSKTSTNSTPSTPSTKTSGSTSAKSGLTQTGDYLRAHPFIVVLVVSGIVALVSWRMSTSRRSRMRRYIRTM